MSITKRASRNIFWLFVSEASSKGLIFLGTIYLARVLGKGGFGLFSLSLAVGIYFWAVVDMGIVGYGTREIARNKQKSGELYSLLNTLRFILAMGLFVIFSGALYLVDMTLEKKLILMAGGFYVVTNSLSPDWVLRGLEKMQYIALGSIATSFFFLVCIYLAVWDSSNTLWASIFYPCSFLFGNLILMAILYFNLKIPFYFKISLSGWRLHIRESFYFAINGALHTITVYIPFFLMGFWSTAEDIGIFSAPHKITALVIRGGGLIVSGLYPILSSLYETNIDDFRRSHAGFQKIIIGVILPICIITTIQSNDITTFLFGISYTESARILTVLIWLSFLIIIRYSFGNALLSANQHRFNMFATGAGTAVVLISSMVLIPAYSRRILTRRPTPDDESRQGLSM